MKICVWRNQPDLVVAAGLRRESAVFVIMVEFVFASMMNYIHIGRKTTLTR